MTNTIYTDADGRALQGFDTVAFFTDGAAVQGSATIIHEWGGATWLFSTEENRDLFTADPEAYAPQFGGHCSVARVMGVSIKGSAKRWHVAEGKLYVNKNLLADSMYPLFARRIHELSEGE